MYGSPHVMDSMSPTNAPEVRSLRKWFLLALIFSLGIHALLFAAFRTKTLTRFTFSSPGERLVPRPFTVKKVVINEELLKPEKNPTTPKREPQKTIIPNDKPSADKLPTEMRLSPTAPAAGDLTRAAAAEKPRVEAAKITNPEANAQVEREIDSISAKIASNAAPKIVAGKGADLEQANRLAHEGEPGPGYSNLDDLLADSGPLAGPVAPVNMPGGALFEFDSAELKGNAVETLQKLGTLIQRNPRASFSIEGHTDSFGTPEYNLKLSKARAEAVKAWLVKHMKLNPATIKTKGFGSSQLIDPATGTREQQSHNRRVEIVITTPKD